ncbi:hypothetical protein ABENE_07800 [Asticcacaulis benevestitus DSM 16100 = ATCC BAA-896]|uniref:Uncharacterized protein n=2 Tax=Asticcacaulis TaxID=76890 RepID=V4PVW8_9CAUL|nr:hypothetical protein ABENE_07800 [Asticcacaulis benevestitus DSM 16100 = ATCC BAA-896]
MTFFPGCIWAQWTRPIFCARRKTNMRIQFTSIDRPKLAAKTLSRFIPSLPLSKAQQALAKASDYRDWHELEQSIGGQATSPPDQMWDEHLFRDRSVDLIIRLSELTGASTGDIQHALARSRLTGDRRWTLDDDIEIRLRIWRRMGLLKTGRHQPGSLVRIKDVPHSASGYMCTSGGLVRVFTERGTGHRTASEIVVPRSPLPDFLPAFLWLPYGFWTLPDGARLVFSREYLPLWYLKPGQKPERIPPWLWIEQIEDETYFAHGREWEWYYPAYRQTCIRWLAENGIHGLPILADALPLFMQSGVTEIEIAVAVMATSTTEPDPTGPWTRYSRYNKVHLDKNDPYF